MTSALTGRPADVLPVGAATAGKPGNDAWGIALAAAIGCFVLATWTSVKYYVILLSATGVGVMVFLWEGLMLRFVVAPRLARKGESS